MVGITRLLDWRSRPAMTAVPGRTGGATAPGRRMTAVPLGLLFLTLLGTLPSPLKVPFLGVSLQNLAVPLGSMALVALLWPQRTRVWRAALPLLPATIALVGWGLVVSALSDHPDLSLRYWIKSLAYLVVFAGFLFLFSVPSLHAASYLTLYCFLAGLALTGVVEMAFPASAVFRAFRTADSLLCYPRIASLLSSPNTYGVLMVLGLTLGERLRAGNRLRGVTYAAAATLFTFQLAQSGSRNAWLVLAGALAWMAIRRMMSPWRAAALAAGLALSLVVLPVPARQAGIKVPAAIPQARFLVRDGDMQSTALCPAPVTFNLRRALWREAVSEFRRRPLQGIGLGVFQWTGGLKIMGKEGYDTHDLPLKILVETGLVGLLLSAAWLVPALRCWPAASDLAEVAVVAVMGGQVFDLFVHDYTHTTILMLAWASFVSRRRDA